MIEPLADLPIDPAIAALPKADLHIHAEAAPRLARVIARREGKPPPDLRETVRALLDLPPGMPRLIQMAVPPRPETEALDAVPENFIARVADALEEAAADGAILVEVRFGGTTILRPYDTEADWAATYRLAERAAAAGLGITVHAGEFSTANLAAALRVPGVTRLGHAVYAARDPRLLDAIARRGITVECALTSNVMLGATASYEEHPIRQFIVHGIPVTLNTDDPVRVGTTIGREYAIAAALGFASAELVALTRNAVRASFTTAERRTALLARVADAERERGT
ncbi:MAG: hypothetical protein LC793_16565 [Thermomicrobia bacterium]|nr:hypothetical protein [Thermomicrobia bacterium]